MALDPIIKVLLRGLEASRPIPMSEGTAEQARMRFRSITVDVRIPAWVTSVEATEDITIPSERGPIAARVYTPHDKAQKSPTVIFLHGGGHVIGDLETHDNQARTLAAKLNAVVVSVEYRLAPEAQWPAGPDDCFAAASWIYDHIDEFGGDNEAIGIAGDSAGGNLSAVTAMRMHAAGKPLTAALLIYPNVDFSPAGDYPSRFEFADGYFLSLADMGWFAQQYVPPGTDIRHPELSPLHADLTQMPPTVVVTAEYDPLRDEGMALAKALREAGVEVLEVQGKGMIHGFFDLAPLVPAAAALVQESSELFASLIRRNA